jgi:hypothetical protein
MQRVGRQRRRLFVPAPLNAPECADWIVAGSEGGIIDACFEAAGAFGFPGDDAAAGPTFPEKISRANTAHVAPRVNAWNLQGFAAIATPDTVFTFVIMIVS